MIREVAARTVNGQVLIEFAAINARAA